MADHGTITVKTGTSNICNNPRQPTVFVVYTSNPGFVGTDHATVYIGAPLMIDIVVSDQAPVQPAASPAPAATRRSGQSAQAGAPRR